MPTVRFKGEYSHITLTTPRLKIFRPKINKAYFATAKIEEITTTSTTETVQETYVVAGGDTLSKIATKKGTTVDAIIESDTKLTQTNKDKLKVGQKITLPSTVTTTETNKKITFEKVNEGALDSELYIVVETEGFQGYSLYFNIKQGKEKGIEEKDGLVTFKDENGNYGTKGEVKVGALCEKHYMNVDDYVETAIYKLQIDHNDKTKKEAWQKALEGKDKKAPLYLLVEGHTVPGQEEININYHGDSEGGEIRGEAINNLWLDSDENWFELIKIKTSVLEEMKKLVDKNYKYGQTGDRTSISDKGLELLDCSETVARYLHKLGITDDVKQIYTGLMTNEKDFRKAINSQKIKFVEDSEKDDFKPQRGDIFVWRKPNGVGHTGIVYKFDSKKDLVTILEAIGKVGSADEKTNKTNGGHTGTNCSRTAVYKRKGKALNQHSGWKGYFRPIDYSKNL